MLNILGKEITKDLLENSLEYFNITNLPKDTCIRKLYKESINNFYFSQGYNIFGMISKGTFLIRNKDKIIGIMMKRNKNGFNIRIIDIGKYDINDTIAATKYLKKQNP